MSRKGTTTSIPPADELSREVSQMEGPALLEFVIRTAIEKNASDLFFLAGDAHYEISMRRLGTLEPIARVSKAMGQQLVNTVKSQAAMDLSEKRKPIDGRWSYLLGESQVEFRANSMGTLHGEDLALRILRQSERLFKIDELGLVGGQKALLKSILDRPGGLLLVTGPTGSGKTTTLYACLQQLNNGLRKINTLEDPIEHRLPGIRQSQIYPKLGLDFSELLTGAMRQAPDVIMVGEIRDPVTAAIVIRAANSGHLVLATMHSPTATSAVQSLVALGINPFFLAHSLVAVIAQRLIRTLDPEKRVEYPLSGLTGTFDEVKGLLEPGQGDAIYGPPLEATGQHEGYHGQTGLFEIMENTPTIREAITAERPAAELRRIALDEGMLDFRRCGLLKVAQGITSIEEITRVIPVEDFDEPESDESSHADASGERIRVSSR